MPGPVGKEEVLIEGGFWRDQGIRDGPQGLFPRSCSTVSVGGLNPFPAGPAEDTAGPHIFSDPPLAHGSHCCTVW